MLRRSLLPTLLLSLAAACGAGSARDRLPRVTAHAGGARSVALPDGRLLRFDAPPWRVLPTNASATDLVLDLLPAERVVGLPEHALQYSRLAGAELPASLADKPRIAAFDVEVVLELAPDLVLTHTWQDAAALEALARRGVPHLSLPVPGDWKMLVEGIDEVARLLGVDERGAALVADLERRRVELLDGGRFAELRLLSFSTYGDALWTNGAGTTYDLMIRLAGMRNAAAEAGLAGNLQIQLEEVLELDPDVFVVGGGAGGTGLDLLRQHPVLSELQAVQAQRYVVLPSHLYSTSSHELLTAAERLVEEVERHYPAQR